MDVFIGLFATNYISAGTELRYDYGIRGCDWQKVKLSVFFYSSFFFLYSFIQIYFGIFFDFLNRLLITLYLNFR